MILKEVCERTSKNQMADYVELYFMIFLYIIKTLEAHHRLKDNLI